MKLFPGALMPLFVAGAVFAADTTDQRISMLEKQVQALEKQAQAKSGDLQVKTQLAGAFLQKLRETGDAGYLSRASAVVNGVLEIDPGFPPAKRLRTEIAMNLHEFPRVAEYTEDMLAANPSDSEMLGLLGDAQMELGQYQLAGKTYQRMTSLGGNLFSFNRLAYHQFVTGHADAALAWMSQAVAAGSPRPENVAWCSSEMGDMLFKVGRVEDAAQAFRYSLHAFPGYHRALAGLARAEASRGEWKAAIADLKAAQAVVPLPEYAGALEFLYSDAGSAKEAAGQRALLDVTEKLMAVNGEKANRTLAVIYADEGRNLSHALELAQAEFSVRNDVYSYDALSWVLFKNGKLEAAGEASSKALALGTPEPSFYFHAGMIASANGDAPAAKTYLAKALALNPQFNLRNASIAAKALQQMDSK